MTDRPAFFDYARDFEIALATGDFARLARHFTPDAMHTVAGDGVFDQDDRGRDAVIEGLRKSVAALDRRFAVRVPEVLAGPLRREDGGLWMHWRMTFRQPGLPELAVEGEHVAHYDGGAIARLDERLLDGSDARANAYLAEHDGALRPAASPPASQGADAARRFRRATLRTLVRAYAAAKSQADAAGALALCAPDFTIETILSVFDFRGGELVRERFHFDLPDFCRQLELPQGAFAKAAL